MRAHVPRIVILMGNHDLLKTGNMYFEFLNALPGVEVITKPTEDAERSHLAMFFPYSKHPAADWKGFDLSHYEYAFMHQTVKGSIASNGQAMDGEQLPPLDAGKVWSGDIHVPQCIGAVEYVGSPYHVHFGDSFTPRCVALDRDGRNFDLRFDTTRRVTLDVVGEEGTQELARLKPGDQVKVRVHLNESEKHEWREFRRVYTDACVQFGLELRGLELKVERKRERISTVARERVLRNPRDAVYRFIEADDLGGSLLDVGLEIMEHP